MKNLSSVVFGLGVFKLYLLICGTRIKLNNRVLGIDVLLLIIPEKIVISQACNAANIGLV